MSCNFSYGGGTYIPAAAQGRTPMGMFNAAVPPTVIPPVPMMTAQTAGQTAAAFQPDRFPVGMGYVPIQKWETPCPMDRALLQGTIFPALDLPFSGRCK